MRYSIIGLLCLCSLFAEQRREPCCSLIVSEPEASPCLIRPNSCMGPELCSSYPALECDYSLHFNIGFLYEQVRLSGTEIALELCGQCAEVPFTGKALHPEFDMTFGVTTALGYYACWDDWYFNLRFNWLKATAHLEPECRKNDRFLPNGFWWREIVPDSPDSCRPNIGCTDKFCAWLSSNYYMLLLDVHRGSFVSYALVIDPHVGLKTVWTEYILHVDTGEIPVAINAELNHKFIHYRDRSQFWGIGPDWGFNTRWLLIEGVSIFCNADVALLFGHTVLHSKAFYAAPYCTPCDECPDCRMEFCNSFRMISPNLRTIIGFQWERDLCMNTQHIYIQAGLDVNYLWNQFATVSWVDDASMANFRANDHNTYSSVGLIFNLGWDF